MSWLKPIFFINSKKLPWWYELVIFETLLIFQISCYFAIFLYVFIRIIWFHWYIVTSLKSVAKSSHMWNFTAFSGNLIGCYAITRLKWILGHINLFKSLLQHFILFGVWYLRTKDISLNFSSYSCMLLWYSCSWTVLLPLPPSSEYSTFFLTCGQWLYWWLSNM